MKIAALTLAAGAGSRFGSLKQLAPINGKPMLQHCIDSANGQLPGAVYTLLGNQSESIQKQITATQVIHHPEWKQGIGSSIAAGVSYLSKEFDAILIMLGDQPLVSSQHLGQLLGLYGSQQAVCSLYQDNLGVPAIFGKIHFHSLTRLTGDQGAKQLLNSLSPAPATLDLALASTDIDYPQDLDRLTLDTD